MQENFIVSKIGVSRIFSIDCAEEIAQNLREEIGSDNIINEKRA
jgi:hypothetical protein